MNLPELLPNLKAELFEQFGIWDSVPKNNELIKDFP